jgi:regulator of sigma D
MFQSKDNARARAVSTCVLLLTAGCSGGSEESELSVERGAVTTITVDERRSLAVTEQTILSRFSLERVLTQLAAQSGVANLTAVQLFQQWWDTQNPGPGVYSGPHCDDSVDTYGEPIINGYPYLCRDGAEGTQVACDPFAAGSSCAYIPIGLFNRFDLAPENGAHCGEHRIVYAKQSGITSTSDRNLVIFEATLPNPHPQQGVKGCQQIVDTWADLSKENSVSKRADALEDFYFDGQGVIGPVIHVDNFGNNPLGVGQIRTNQFVTTTTGWSLREFKLQRTCAGQACTALHFVPVTNKNNAYGPLFAPASNLSTAPAFQSFFPSQVASLAASTVPQIDIGVPDLFNTAQSQASGSTAAEMKYRDQLGSGASTLRSDIQTQLTALGSSLTPDEIALRAQAQSCAGCHRLNNNVDIGGGLIWPASLGFTHVTERETEVVGGQTRFRLSNALIDALLPARKAILEDFLNDRPRPSKGPDHPLSGSRSHG